jgi:hypothetical protein
MRSIMAPMLTLGASRCQLGVGLAPVVWVSVRFGISRYSSCRRQSRHLVVSEVSCSTQRQFTSRRNYVSGCVEIRATSHVFACDCDSNVWVAVQVVVLFTTNMLNII